MFCRVVYMTQEHEIRAWLGDGWTEQQVEQITAEYRAAEHLVAGDQEESQSLLTAIAQRVDGTLDRAELVEADTAAYVRAAEARRALRAAVRAEVCARDLSEVKAAQTYGVDRMTVRKWMGK